MSDSLVMQDRVFQSTPSAWRETLPRCPHGTCRTFQSTPSAWRETDCITTINVFHLYFNPLPPHGGRRMGILDVPLLHRYFNPLPPHGGRHVPAISVSVLEDISIHSLRMEGDIKKSGYSVFVPAFQSTPSAWRETAFFFAATVGIKYFNPLPPHGGRPTHSESFCIAGFTFQSTPSAWRETPRRQELRKDWKFQSTPSAWRETFCSAAYAADKPFQSTPSAWRETLRS